MKVKDALEEINLIVTKIVEADDPNRFKSGKFLRLSLPKSIGRRLSAAAASMRNSAKSEGSDKTGMFEKFQNTVL